jgi:hypothetical protein
MSESVCKFCGGDNEVSNDVCDPCWYGMRFDPEEWEKRLVEMGRAPKHVGGCVHIADEAGKFVAVVCRNPFEPGETP